MILRSPDAASASPSRAAPPLSGGELRDRTIRLVGVPFFGLAIPRVAGLFGDLTWREPAYWFGTLWFVAISLVVWQGNLALQRWHRSHLDWLQRPGRKLLAMLAANLIYTTPVSVAMLVAWYLAAPLPAIDWRATGLATALIVGAVAIITHIYETVFLIHERHEDQRQVAFTERARWHAELATLKGQLAPHFLFNCLNTLAVLIDEDPRLARKFNQHLANVCRYLLKHKDRDLVPLDEELAFFDAYVELTRLRYTDNVQVARRGLEPARHFHLPPASLQLLLENALKHNACSSAAPLPLELRLEGDALVVSNPLRPRAGGTDGASLGVGLQNLRARFALAAGREPAVARERGEFRVTLPLVRLP